MIKKAATLLSLVSLAFFSACQTSSPPTDPVNKEESGPSRPDSSAPPLEAPDNQVAAPPKKSIPKKKTSSEDEPVIPRVSATIFQKPLFLKIAYKKNPNSSFKTYTFRCRAGVFCKPTVFFSQIQFKKKKSGCLKIYGGPEMLYMSGSYGSQKVSALFSRQDGCEIERFETIKPFLVAAKFER